MQQNNSSPASTSPEVAPTLNVSPSPANASISQDANSMEIDSNNLELPSPATVTGSGCTLSKANVDKLQSTVNQLTIDTTLASAKVSTLTGAARRAAVLELEDLTKTLRMSMELLSQLRASLPSSPTSYKIPMYSQNKVICPANLPYFQWEGAVFDNKNTIFVDVDACLTKFEDVMYLYNLNFTNEYSRLLPPTVCYHPISVLGTSRSSQRRNNRLGRVQGRF
jgi:hypothetical protein